jgi:uncharacterized protein with HEPN domain
MREPLRDKERLQHMLAAAERVIRYTSGKSFEDLKADDMMYYAVVKNIEIMGEAANLLSSEFVDSHPDTPWKQVRGMRNYIVHEYFQIDSVVVWDVVTKDLSALQNQIEKYLTDTDWEQWEKDGNSEPQ